MENAGHVSDAIGCSIALADIRIAQGRLHEAMQTYERGITLAAQQPAPSLRGVPDMHVGMSELFRERNDLARATQHLLSSEDLGERAGLAQNPYRWRVAMARVREAEGDLDAALELLDEAERLYASDYYPNVRPIPAMKARIWIAQGQLSQALGWARVHGVSVKDELSYVREFDHITLARLLLAGPTRDRGDDPAREAPELLESSPSGGGSRSTDTQRHRDPGAARRSRIRCEAMSLRLLRRSSAPSRWQNRRATSASLLDEGPSMAALLGAAAKREIAPGYVRQLLTAFGPPTTRAPDQDSLWLSR